LREPYPRDAADHGRGAAQGDDLGRGQPGELPAGGAARGEQRGFAFALGDEQPGYGQLRGHGEQEQLQCADREQ